MNSFILPPTKYQMEYQWTLVVNTSIIYYSYRISELYSYGISNNLIARIDGYLVILILKPAE